MLRFGARAAGKSIEFTHAPSALCLRSNGGSPPNCRRLNGQKSPERSEVLTQPIGELASIDAARRQVEHDAFLITYLGVDLRAVQNEKRLHSGMPNALVAVDEGMVLDQREAEHGRLLHQRGIQIDTTKRRLGL